MKDFTYEIKRDTKPHILSAIIGADSFFYGLFDQNYKLLGCTYQKDVDFSPAFVEQIAAELAPYADLQQRIAFSTKPFLHVSASEEDVSRYYPSYDDKLVEHEKLTAQDIKVLYGLKGRHLALVEEAFSKPECHHISTVLHNAAYPNRKVMVHMHIDNDTVHLLAAATDQLRYYNQFYCVDEKDYLYFVLLAYQQLGYDTNEVPLSVSGRVSKDSDIYNLMHGYIRHIDFVSPDLLRVEDIRFRKTKHYYHDLFSTSICGS